MRLRTAGRLLRELLKMGQRLAVRPDSALPASEPNARSGNGEPAIGGAQP
jgi:hypothetical protein